MAKELPTAQLLEQSLANLSRPTDAQKSQQLVNLLAGLSSAFSQAGAPRTLAQGGPGALDLGSVAAGLQALQGRQKQSRLADLQAGLVAIPAIQKIRKQKLFDDRREDRIKAYRKNGMPDLAIQMMEAADTPEAHREAFQLYFKTASEDNRAKAANALSKSNAELRASVAIRGQDKSAETAEKGINARFELQRREQLATKDLNAARQDFKANQNALDRDFRTEMQDKDNKAAMVRLGITNDVKLKIARDKLANDMAISKIKAVKLSDVSSLRSQYRQAIKKPEEAQLGLAKVNEAAKEDTGAGDVALIFGFMKVIDPESTVREGEFATVEQTAGIPARISNLYNRALRGERLSAEQRQDIVKAARSQFKPYKKAIESLNSSFSDIAKRNNMDPRDVIVGIESGTTTGGPRVLDLDPDGL